MVVGVTAHTRAQIKSRSLHTFVSCCSGGVLSLTAPDDTRMVVSGGDGTVASYVGEGKEWVDEATVKVQGAVHNVSSSPDGAEVLAGTADGHIYRIKLGARGTRPTVLPVCESHASAAASLEEGLGRARTCARPLHVRAQHHALEVRLAEAVKQSEEAAQERNQMLGRLQVNENSTKNLSRGAHVARVVPRASAGRDVRVRDVRRAERPHGLVS